MIGNLEVGSYDACKNRCEQDARCKFVFYITSKNYQYNNCKIYSSCDEFRTPTNPGDTYSRDRTCPSKILH